MVQLHILLLYPYKEIPTSVLLYLYCSYSNVHIPNQWKIRYCKCTYIYILLHYIQGIISTIGKTVTFEQQYFQWEPRAKLYFAIHAEAVQEEAFQFKNQQTITSVMVITHFKLFVPRAANFTLSHILSSGKMGGGGEKKKTF